MPELRNPPTSTVGCSVLGKLGATAKVVSGFDSRMDTIEETKAGQLARTRQLDDPSQLGVALFGELKQGSGDFFVAGAIARSDSRDTRFHVSVSGSQACSLCDDSEPGLSAQIARMIAGPVPLEFQLRGLEAMAELGPIRLTVVPY